MNGQTEEESEKLIQTVPSIDPDIPLIGFSLHCAGRAIEIDSSTKSRVFFFRSFFGLILRFDWRLADYGLF